MENTATYLNVWTILGIWYTEVLILVALANNITGEMLLECDQSVLKEMGVTKVGDRVLIFVAVNALRTKVYGPKTSNRVNAVLQMLHFDITLIFTFPGYHCFP